MPFPTVPAAWNGGSIMLPPLPLRPGGFGLSALGGGKSFLFPPSAPARTAPSPKGFPAPGVPWVPSRCHHGCPWAAQTGDGVWERLPEEMLGGFGSRTIGREEHSVRRRLACWPRGTGPGQGKCFPEGEQAWGSHRPAINLSSQRKGNFSNGRRLGWRWLPRGWVEAQDEMLRGKHCAHDVPTCCRHRCSAYNQNLCRYFCTPNRSLRCAEPSGFALLKLCLSRATLSWLFPSVTWRLALAHWLKRTSALPVTLSFAIHTDSALLSPPCYKPYGCIW